MKITNPKKFEKIVKTLARFDKWDKKHPEKKKPYNNVIYYSDNKLYATEGHVMAMIDISDCVNSCSNDTDCVFPSNVIAKKTLETDIHNKLVIDGKKIDCEQFETKFYKRVIPTENPKAELTLDFSEYGNLNIGYEKLAFVEISKNKIVFDYQDEVETICTVEDCFSTNLLDNDFGNFQTVNFSMWQIFEIMKISKKFKIQQFNQIDRIHKIIDGDYEFLIMPFKR